MCCTADDLLCWQRCADMHARPQVLPWRQQGLVGLPTARPGRHQFSSGQPHTSYVYAGRVDVGGTVTANDIMIATGSVPFVPPGIPIDGKTVNTACNTNTAAPRLAIIIWDMHLC